MDGMEEIIQDFLVETDELIEALEGNLVELENSPEDKDLLNRIFRSFHTIKGASGFLGFDQIVELSHALEDLLNKLRSGELKVTPSIMDGILKGVDMLKLLINHVREGDGKREDLREILSLIKGLETGEGEEVSKEAAEGSRLETKPPSSQPTAEGSMGFEAGKAKEVTTEAREAKNKEEVPQEPHREPKMLGEMLVEKGVITEEQLLEAVRDQKGKERLGEVLVRKGYAKEEDIKKVLSDQGRGRSGETTLRVDTARLDNLMDMVGELVLERNRIMRLTDQLEGRYGDDDLVANLRQAVYGLDVVTSDLQLSVMKIRMQPVAKVFSRFPRMVRDLARAKGKKVDLLLVGKETEVDKTIIEEIGDPLVHLVRNAVDHGIEPEEERLKAGKPPQGKIILSAGHRGGRIEITIEDDGKGIDVEKVKKKALEKGLTTEEELNRMGERDIINFIFHPGFSTADKVTDVSGRGVGMDVVKSNVVKVGGTIEIDTQKGKGTKFTLSLPLTLAIINALMVKAGGEEYALPLSSVVEIINLANKEVQTINGREVIEFRGDIYPVVRLSNFVMAPLNGDSRYALIIALGERRLALLVDELGSQEEVVIKSLGGYLSKVDGISGATITGDGRVVPILDVSGLFQVESTRGEAVV